MQVFEVKRLNRFYIMPMCSINSRIELNVIDVSDSVCIIISGDNRSKGYSSRMKFVFVGNKHPASIDTIQNQAEKPCFVGSIFEYEPRSLSAIGPDEMTRGLCNRSNLTLQVSHWPDVSEDRASARGKRAGEVIADIEETLNPGLAAVDKLLGEVDAMVVE